MAEPSLRELRRQRERAEDWISYASWTAIGTAIAGILILLYIGFDTLDEEDGGLQAVIPLIVALTSQALVGWKLRTTNSFWAAWALMTNYLLSVVLQSIWLGWLSAIPWKILIATIYIRGFLAVDAWHELGKAIDKAESPA